MEENLNQEAETQTNFRESDPPFKMPEAIKRSKKSPWILIVVFGALILGGVGLFLVGRGTKVKEIPTPTATSEVEASTPESSPTATPKPIDKTSIRIKVMNGTGIPKEAAYLADLLKKLGYTKIEASNADKEDYTDTKVTFSSALDKSVVDEIMSKLEEVYKKVIKSTETIRTNDVEIIIGLRKGTTAKPTATSTPKTSPTPTAKASPSPTATATPTPTPTAT